MCFRIHPRQKKWRKVIVYKALEATHTGTIMSPHRSTEWEVGKVMKATGKKTFSLNNYGDPEASAGIYVFKSEYDARCYMNVNGILAIMKVDPKDFLFHDSSLTMATYKKAKLVKILDKKWGVLPFQTVDDLEAMNKALWKSRRKRAKLLKARKSLIKKGK